MGIRMNCGVRDLYDQNETQCSTVCPTSSPPFYTVTYNMKWVTTYWKLIAFMNLIDQSSFHFYGPRPQNRHVRGVRVLFRMASVYPSSFQHDLSRKMRIIYRPEPESNVCPRRSDLFYIVTY